MAVWFHGGDFNLGDENQLGSPIGLIDAARAEGAAIIWVSLDPQQKTILLFPRIVIANSSRSGLTTGSEHLVDFLHQNLSRKGVSQMSVFKIRSWHLNGSETISKSLADFLTELLFWENQPELLPSFII